MLTHVGFKPFINTAPKSPIFRGNGTDDFIPPGARDGLPDGIPRDVTDQTVDAAKKMQTGTRSPVVTRVLREKRLGIATKPKRKPSPPTNTDPAGKPTDKSSSNGIPPDFNKRLKDWKKNAGGKPHIPKPTDGKNISKPTGEANDSDPDLKKLKKEAEDWKKNKPDDLSGEEAERLRKKVFGDDQIDVTWK